MSKEREFGEGSLKLISRDYNNQYLWLCCLLHPSRLLWQRVERVWRKEKEIPYFSNDATVGLQYRWPEPAGRLYSYVGEDCL